MNSNFQEHKLIFDQAIHSDSSNSKSVAPDLEIQLLILLLMEIIKNNNVSPKN